MATPVLFWGLLCLSLIFFCVLIRTTAGTMDEITSLLSSKKYTGAELSANYAYLIAKYGEWVIGTGSGGFQLYFINMQNALFGGWTVASLTLMIVCFIGAIAVKVVLPKVITKIERQNQDMVNLTILEKDE